MVELDPLDANLPPAPPRPPLRFALAGFGVFLAGSALSYLLFTVLLVLAAPSRNTALAVLGIFLLVAGSGTSTTLALVVYQRRVNRWKEEWLRGQAGAVFTVPAGPSDR